MTPVLCQGVEPGPERLVNQPTRALEDALDVYIRRGCRVSVGEGGRHKETFKEM